MWPYFMFDCLRRYLAAQKITWPFTATAILTVFSHTAVSKALVVEEYGVVGAGYANAIANWTLFVLLSALIALQRLYYSTCGPNASASKRLKKSLSDYNIFDNDDYGNGGGASCSNDGESLGGGRGSNGATISAAADPGEVLLMTWPSPFTYEIFAGWGQLLKLGIPSAISLFIEWGGFEVNATMAGRLGVEQLATHSVFAQYSALFYALPNGVAQAAATLGSNALGGGDASTAKRLVPLAYIMCIVCGVLQGGILLCNRSRMGRLFSLDADVVSMTSKLAPIFCIGYEISDVWKCAGMLYLRETGRPTICAQAGAGSMIAFALPLAYCLAMLWGFGLSGIWIGMSAGWYLCGGIFAFVLWKTDWDAEAKKAVATQAASLS